MLISTNLTGYFLIGANLVKVDYFFLALKEGECKPV